MAGSDLHGLAIRFRWRNSGWKTPLLNAILGYINLGVANIGRKLGLVSVVEDKIHDFVSAIPQSAPILLRNWLLALSTAGIDLTEYGRKEQQVHLKRGVKKNLNADI